MTEARANKSSLVVPNDFEARSVDVEQQDLRLWLQMMALHKAITSELRRRLRASFGMSLSRFDFMSQLNETRDGLRMGEVSARLMVTTGNITGLADELEADGLIERMADPSSRRACLVRLTAKGRAEFRAMAKAHKAWIVEFFSIISQKDKKMLLELVGSQNAFVLSRIQGAANPTKIMPPALPGGGETKSLPPQKGTGARAVRRRTP